MPESALIAFVGRRPFEIAELFVVKRNGAERLRSANCYGSAQLDWTGDYPALLELSHAVLEPVAGQAPSRDVAARFALEVLAQLPDDGFVIQADDVATWILWSTQPGDWSTPPSSKRAWWRQLLHRRAAAWRLPNHRDPVTPPHLTGGKTGSEPDRTEILRDY